MENNDKPSKQQLIDNIQQYLLRMVTGSTHLDPSNEPALYNIELAVQVAFRLMLFNQADEMTCEKVNELANGLNSKQRDATAKNYFDVPVNQNIAQLEHMILCEMNNVETTERIQRKFDPLVRAMNRGLITKNEYMDRLKEIYTDIQVAKQRVKIFEELSNLLK